MKSPPTPETTQQALVHEMLERIADKWTLLVIEELAQAAAELRFTHLAQRIPGVSQKMLTKTLRQLERDGLVTRRVHPVIPPHVDYALTPRGESLGEATCGIWLWAEKHGHQVLQSRQAYDARAVRPETAAHSTPVSPAPSNASDPL